MEQKQNDYITLEASVRFQMRDYRIVLGLKRAWIIAIIVGLVQIFEWFMRGRP